VTAADNGRLGPDQNPAAVAERVFREEQGAVVATLIRHLGAFQPAEDAVQDAFAAAMATWPHEGIPGNPGAWIMVTARRKAIDRLRRERAVADRAARLAELARLEAQEHRPEAADSAVADDRLLIFRYVFGGAIDSGGLPYVDFLVPGLVVTMALWSGMGAATGVAEDMEHGFFDRLRSLPISGLSVMAGRCLADTALVTWGLLVSIALGFAAGFRTHGSVAGALA
jgi:ABC-type Na+ efflux pump permease subunit